MRFLRWEKKIDSRLLAVIQAVLIMCWLSVLKDTDSRHSIYSLLGILAIFSMCDNHRDQRLLSRGQCLSCGLLSGLFSGAVALANYAVFEQVRDPVYVSAATNRLQNLLNLAVCLAGGCVVAYQILTAMLARLPLKREKDDRSRPGMVFLISFAAVVLIDLVYLFLDEYPGHVTPDSLDQIIQGYQGTYINNHPFWHTYWIKLVLTLGYGLFGSANGAVALFSVLQILFMAACFAYALMTLYQAGVPKWCVAVGWGLYALLPHNIAMSITMWKDVPFAGGCLLFVVALYRLLASLDRKDPVACLLLAIGAVILSLSRNLGAFLVLAACLLGLPVLWKRSKTVVCLLAAVVVICILLTGPVLTAAGVEGTDFTESLSIPLQQLARVVYDGCPLTDEETELLNRIFDLEEIPQLYTGWLSDPIKLEVRENDIGYFRENIGDYGKLWVRLGLKYPAEYVKAWVDQTKGYWNGGYDYHQYAEMVEENAFGIAKTSGNNIVAKLIYLYFGLTRHFIIFEPLLSIGLQVWILMGCGFVNLLKKRKEWLLSIPALCVIAALLVGTPVYAEFRYAYAVFLTCPFVLLVTVFDAGGPGDHNTLSN